MNKPNKPMAEVSVTNNMGPKQAMLASSLQWLRSLISQKCDGWPKSATAVPLFPIADRLIMPAFSMGHLPHLMSSNSRM